MTPQRNPAVDRAEFASYYGRPIVKEPAWLQPDVPLYLFLGGTAGTSAMLASLAGATSRTELARATRYAASLASVASVGALIHDLGRPERFLYMLRVFKPTSPLSIGSWILAPFSGLAGFAAASELTGKLPRIGRVAGGGAAVLGAPMCTYTAVLLADTATPSWHEGSDTLPILFAGSALTSGAGLALATVPVSETTPATRLGLAGAAAEFAAARKLEHGLGVLSEPYRTGRAGRLLKAAKGCTAAGAGLSVLGRTGKQSARGRLLAALGGVCYLAAGLCTRFGVFDAGVESARDPKYVVLPQRERMAQERAETGERVE